MIKLSFFLVGIFVLKFIVSQAHAQTRHERVRNGRQHERIQQGVESGALTHNEARKLKLEEREIRKAERAASADGKVTIEEKKKIQQMQNSASQDINNMKNNNRKQRN